MFILVCKIDVYKKIQNGQQSILETSDMYLSLTIGQNLAPGLVRFTPPHLHPLPRLFKEQIEEEVKCLYVTFPQHPMTDLTGVLKREHEVAEKFHLSYGFI